jgi:hypothetical protein
MIGLLVFGMILAMLTGAALGGGVGALVFVGLVVEALS